MVSSRYISFWLCLGWLVGLLCHHFLVELEIGLEDQLWLLQILYLCAGFAGVYDFCCQFPLSEYQAVTEEAEVLCFLQLLEVYCGHSVVQTIRTHIHLHELHCSVILSHPLQLLGSDLKIHILDPDRILSPPLPSLAPSQASLEFKWLEDDTVSFFFRNNKVLIVLLDVSPHCFLRVKSKHYLTRSLSNPILHNMDLLDIPARGINLRVNLLLVPSFGEVVPVRDVSRARVDGVLPGECLCGKAKERSEFDHNYNVNSVCCCVDQRSGTLTLRVASTLVTKKLIFF